MLETFESCVPPSPKVWNMCPLGNSFNTDCNTFEPPSSSYLNSSKSSLSLQVDMLTESLRASLASEPESGVQSAATRPADEELLAAYW